MTKEICCVSGEITQVDDEDYELLSRFKWRTQTESTHVYSFLTNGFARFGERYSLGAYATEDEAAKAYDAKAKELHGNFAVLNYADQGSV